MPAEEGPALAAPPPLRAEPTTIAWIAEHARALRDAESSRGESLDAKAATLAGFAGVVLSVTAAFATRSTLHTTASSAVFAISLALLVGAGGAALGALLPRRTAQPDVSELERFLSPQLATTRAADVQSRTVRASASIVRHNRAVNDRKARLLQLAATLLACGLVALAGFALSIQLYGRSSTGSSAGHTRLAPPGRRGDAARSRADDRRDRPAVRN
jgi:hypothetical protein